MFHIWIFECTDSWRSVCRHGLQLILLDISSQLHPHHQEKSSMWYAFKYTITWCSMIMMTKLTTLFYSPAVSSSSSIEAVTQSPCWGMKPSKQSSMLKRISLLISPCLLLKLVTFPTVAALWRSCKSTSLWLCSSTAVLSQSLSVRWIFSACQPPSSLYWTANVCTLSPIYWAIFY